MEILFTDEELTAIQIALNFTSESEHFSTLEERAAGTAWQKVLDERLRRAHS